LKKKIYPANAVCNAGFIGLDWWISQGKILVLRAKSSEGRKSMRYGHWMPKSKSDWQTVTM
jgi:hypothetical protein